MTIAPLAKENGLLVFDPTTTNSAVTKDDKVVNPRIFRACFFEHFQGHVLVNISFNVFNTR